MSHAYRAVQWNRHKRLYDVWLAVGIVGLLGTFVGGTMALGPPRAPDAPVVLIRGLALTAMTLLHIILSIGPLARLNPRFAPVLYNRRHLGVAFFVIAFMHAALATMYYGGFGVRNPLSAVLSGAGGPGFEVFGFVALLIFAVMAATSHDFWLAHLGPRMWKSLHMGVYLAYGLVILHVAFGAMSAGKSMAAPIMLTAGICAVGGLHIAAAVLTWRLDRSRNTSATSVVDDADEADADQWIDVGPLDAIVDSHATVVAIPGSDQSRTEVAVFRDGDTACAVSNQCPHQGGPLGEGRIIDGCITCPWHGHQFRTGDGKSPPPYTDCVPTYPVRVTAGRVEINLKREPSDVE